MNGDLLSALGRVAANLLMRTYAPHRVEAWEPNLGGSSSMLGWGLKYGPLLHKQYLRLNSGLEGSVVRAHGLDVDQAFSLN